MVDNILHNNIIMTFGQLIIQRPLFYEYVYKNIEYYVS